MLLWRCTEEKKTLQISFGLTQRFKIIRFTKTLQIWYCLEPYLLLCLCNFAYSVSRPCWLSSVPPKNSLYSMRDTVAWSLSTQRFFLYDSGPWTSSNCHPSTLNNERCDTKSKYILLKHDSFYCEWWRHIIIYSLLHFFSYSFNCLPIIGISWNRSNALLVFIVRHCWTFITSQCPFRTKKKGENSIFRTYSKGDQREIIFWKKTWRVQP